MVDPTDNVLFGGISSEKQSRVCREPGGSRGARWDAVSTPRWGCSQWKLRGLNIRGVIAPRLIIHTEPSVVHSDYLGSTWSQESWDEVVKHQTQAECPLGYICL